MAFGRIVQKKPVSIKPIKIPERVVGSTDIPPVLIEHKSIMQTIADTLKGIGFGEISTETHYAELIPPIPGTYSGPEPYTAKYPAPAIPIAPRKQMTPEQAYPELTMPTIPESTFVPRSMPAFSSYNPFEGLGFYENPLLDSEYVAPPPLPAPVSVPVVKPVPPVFSYNPFSSYWKK